MSSPAAGVRRVLIVEDDEALREVLCDALSDEGFSVASAADGLEALDRLGRSSSPRPSVILLDLTMPRMNGWQFRAAQRTDERIAAIPVVILSAAGNLADEAESLGVPSGAWLRKPVPLRSLLAMLARHCPESGGPALA